MVSQKPITDMVFRPEFLYNKVYGPSRLELIWKVQNTWFASPKASSTVEGMWLRAPSKRVEGSFKGLI